MLTLTLLSTASYANLNTAQDEKSGQCIATEAQLKRVQSYMKQGIKEKWGRKLSDYQVSLFQDIDKHCFRSNGIAAGKKQKKILKKEAQDHGLSMGGEKKTIKLKKNLKESQVAEIGPPGSITPRKNVNKLPKASKKSKAWKLWYKPGPECWGKLDMDSFVYCNKLEKAQRKEFDKLWQTRQSKTQS